VEEREGSKKACVACQPSITGKHQIWASQNTQKVPTFPKLQEDEYYVAVENFLLRNLLTADLTAF